MGRDFSSGVAITGSTVNPFTSGGGGVRGYNYQNVPNDPCRHFTFTGNGSGLDVGLSIQAVGAWGSGDWTGDFKSVNVSLGIFSASIFWSPGKGGWAGFTYGLGGGLPGGLAYEETNYSHSCECKK